jgi:hypothetical protein
MNLTIYSIFILFSIVLIIYSVYKIYFESETIYVSLTTIPERLIHPWFYNNLKHLMNLNGNYKVVLNIPYKFKRTGENYIIPDNIRELENKNLIINRVDTDYGPLTKLYGSLLNPYIPDNSAILVCDDDIVYKSDFVVNIYNEYKRDKTKMYTYCYNRSIEGYHGYMIQKKVIKPILNIKRPESCFRVDDNFIEKSIELLNIKTSPVTYDGRSDGFCCIDKKKTDTHPDWYELEIDTLNNKRELITDQCKKDIIILNNIV